MFGVIMPLCNRMFCCIFGWYFYIEIRLIYEKIILLSSSRAFSLSTLWKTMLFVSSRAFLLSTLVENSETTWKKARKCNKNKSVFKWPTSRVLKFGLVFMDWYIARIGNLTSKVSYSLQIISCYRKPSCI